MKHLGITHKRGDDSYEYESRCMLGQLEARMKTTGQKFGSWVRTLEDGTVIVATIIMNGVVPIYRVNVIAPLSELSSTELTVLSGLFSVKYYSTTGPLIDISTAEGEGFVPYPM